VDGYHIGGATVLARDDVFARLEKRLGRVHARLRLGLEADHEARVFGRGIKYFHFENVSWSHAAIHACVRLSGLYRRGRANAETLTVTYNQIASARVPPDFHGFRILQLSDLHVDISSAAIKRLRAILPRLDYDICVMTGDYRGATHGSYKAAMDGMADLCSAIDRPMYGVLGNHDTIRMLPGLEDLGIRMLLNEAVHLERAAARIFLAGVDDANFYGSHNLEKAAAALALEEFSILLSHTPELYQQAAHAEFDVMLSGHTHGGQICLPGGIAMSLDAVLPRSMGAGSWKYHNLIGYTSRGVGTSIVPVRFNCPPEVTIHELRAVDAHQ
jgi:uncharacterized protein